MPKEHDERAAHSLLPGRRAGLHHTTIGALRKGEVHSRETLAKFARTFNVPQKTIFEAAGMTSERVTHRTIAKELKQISDRLDELSSLVLEAE